MIEVINRASGQKECEIVYGGAAIAWLYGGSTLGKTLAHLSARLPFVSAFYGWLMKQPSSKKKIAPFIEKFQVDASEFKNDTFNSFNDFFIRELKVEARPLSPPVLFARLMVATVFFKTLINPTVFTLRVRNLN